MAGLKSLKTFPFKSMLVILGVFLMIAVFLFAERSGIQYTEKNRKVAYLSQEEVVTEQMAAKSLPKTCLVLRNSEDEASVAAWEQFQQIFKDMKVGTDVVDLQSASSIPDYHAYETVVVLLSDVSPLKENLMELCDWVSEGGNVLFALTLQKTAYSSVIEQKLGIVSSGYDNIRVDSIYFEPEFMLGGGQAYAITDPYDSAWAVQLSENAKVYARVNEKNGQPVIWENQYGKGKFVVDNFGLYEKVVRGFYAASYSLLTDVGVYPDDLLDEDRGAALGWEKMKGNLADYMDWLVDSAPSLRQLTGSELSGAIQRYGAVTFTKTVTERSIELKLKNFYDEAYFMVRINEGTPGEVSGGKLTHLTGNLYLLQAKKPTVTIEKLED